MSRSKNQWQVAHDRLLVAAVLAVPMPEGYMVREDADTSYEEDAIYDAAIEDILNKHRFIPRNEHAHWCATRNSCNCAPLNLPPAKPVKTR